MKRHLRSMPFWGFAIAAAVVVLASGGILACDTPVYRYAMYRWEPAPYEIYYFHDAEIAPEVAELHQAIEDASRDEKQPANVILIPAHVKDDPELKRIPPDVRKLWSEQEDPQVPVYLFVSPHGTLLRQGDLDLPLLKKLLDSPVRQKVATQLEKGCAGVMVMLTGSDAEANRNAKQVVQKLQKDIAEGEIELYLPPPMFGPPGEEAPEAPTIEIGFCELQRDSKEEQWLVESLLSIESDLKDEEFASQPMIFCVFGRGQRTASVHRQGDQRGQPAELCRFHHRCLLLHRQRPEPGDGPVVRQRLVDRRREPGQCVWRRGGE